MRKVWRRRTEGRKQFVLEGARCILPAARSCPGGVGGDGAMCGWVGTRQASLTAPRCEGSVLEEDAPSELVHHSLVCGRSSVEVSLTRGGWGVGNLGAGV